MVGSKALVYQPHPVYVPGEAGVRRHLYSDRVGQRYIRDCSDVRLSGEDLLQYDDQTLFYDLFFSADKKHLFCIGPPFLDFGYPLAILCQGRSLPFRMEGGRKDVLLSCVRVDMRGIRETAGLRLDFRFADFEVSTRCSPQVVMSAPEGAWSVALTTLQKDNDPQWLEDWCTWYCREHGVRLIIIYDNDSRNFEAVYALLAKFHGARLIFVRWPYLFGPVRGRWENKYCKLVFFEHSRLFFYHFRGLGTGWRARYFNQLAQKRRARAVANENIVEDERIKRMKNRLESASGRPETLC